MKGEEEEEEEQKYRGILMTFLKRNEGEQGHVWSRNMMNAKAIATVFELCEIPECERIVKCRFRNKSCNIYCTHNL